MTTSPASIPRAHGPHSPIENSDGLPGDILERIKERGEHYQGNNAATDMACDPKGRASCKTQCGSY
jgi:hypothetical protein